MSEVHECSKCGKPKAAAEFYVRKDGQRNYWCKACYREWHRTRYTPEERRNRRAS